MPRHGSVMRWLGCTLVRIPIPDCLGEVSEAILLGHREWSRLMTLAIHQPIGPLQMSVRLHSSSKALLPTATCDCDQIADHPRTPSDIEQGHNHAELLDSIAEYELHLVPAGKRLPGHFGRVTFDSLRGERAQEREGRLDR